MKTVTAVGTQGEATVPGSEVRRALGLRSTWFRIGVLSLSSPAEPITSGKKVALSGVARSMPSVKLEQRTSGTPWSAVRQVAPGPGGTGSRSRRVRASRPTSGSSSGDARSRVAHVKVAPLVRLQGLEERDDVARVRAPGSRRRGRLRPAPRREPVGDVGPRRARRERRLPGRGHALSGQLPRADRAGPRLRRRCQPDAEGRSRHETPRRSRSLSSRSLRRLRPPPRAMRSGSRTGPLLATSRSGSSCAPVRGRLVLGAVCARGDGRHTAATSRRFAGLRLSSAYAPRAGSASRRTTRSSRASGIWRRIRAFEAWPELPLLETVRVAIIDSGIESTHPEFANQIAGGKSFVSEPVAGRHERARHVRRRRDRGVGQQRAGNRGHRLHRRDLLIAKVVRRRRHDRARGGGPRDPLGGRQRRAGDQHQLRRRARSVRPEPRHVLAPRGRGGRVRRGKGVLVVAAVGNGDRAPQSPGRSRATRRRSRTCSA